MLKEFYHDAKQHVKHMSVFAGQRQACPDCSIIKPCEYHKEVEQEYVENQILNKE